MIILGGFGKIPYVKMPPSQKTVCVTSFYNAYVKKKRRRRKTYLMGFFPGEARIPSKGNGPYVHLLFWVAIGHPEKGNATEAEIPLGKVTTGSSGGQVTNEAARPGVCSELRVQ